MGAAERGKGMRMLSVVAVAVLLYLGAAVLIGIGVHKTTRYD